jgi:endonuclease-3
MPSPVEIYRMMELHLGDLGNPVPLKTGRDPFAVLVSTVISLRTRDAVTEEVSATVLGRASDPKTLHALPAGELESLLRPAGFYRQKARQLRGISEDIIGKYGGHVPSSMEDLLSLPGVGRKTACYMSGMVFGIPAVCVDVHVHRISNRTGLVHTGSAAETERALMKLFPEDMWNRINHMFVRFGQRVCRPRFPQCDRCPFGAMCPSSKEKSGD